MKMKMKMKKSFYIALSILFINCSLERDIAYIEKVQDPEFFQNAMQNLTDIIVYDIFSPPVASRVYLYPTIAAYEVMALKYPKKYNSLEIVKNISLLVGGKGGGGREDLAQGGGTEINKINDAIKYLYKIVN